MDRVVSESHHSQIKDLRMKQIKLTSRKGKQLMEKFSKKFLDEFDNAMEQIKENAPEIESAEKIQKALSVFIICKIMDGWSSEDQEELIIALQKDL